MKKTLFIFFAISILLSAQDLKRYQFKSGKIVYKSIGITTGTETVYFDNYGMLEAKYSRVLLDTMNLAGMKQEIDAKTIIDNNWIYTIDLSTNTCSKIKNPFLEMIPIGADLEKIGEQTMIKLGAKKAGTEEFLGKICDIWEIAESMSKVWMWKSIALKTEIGMGIILKQTAESVEVDIPVSADEFKLPEGIEVQEINADDLNGMMGN